jgi:hypothetical protein
VPYRPCFVHAPGSMIAPHRENPHFFNSPLGFKPRASTQRTSALDGRTFPDARIALRDQQRFAECSGSGCAGGSRVVVPSLTQTEQRRFKIGPG